MENYLQMLNSVLAHLTNEEQDKLLLVIKNIDNYITNSFNIAKS